MKHQKKVKIHNFRVYAGYGGRGAEVKLAILQQAGREGLKISKFVMKALKKAYPQLPL